jgi:hypothetical protein
MNQRQTAVSEFPFRNWRPDRAVSLSRWLVLAIVPAAIAASALISNPAHVDGE